MGKWKNYVIQNMLYFAKGEIMKNLLLVASIFLMFVLNGCFKQAIPMSRADVRDITRGDVIDLKYATAYPDKCVRLTEEQRARAKTIMREGTSGEFEIAGYDRTLGILKIRNVNYPNDIMWFHRSLNMCNRIHSGYARPSMDVYIH